MKSRNYELKDFTKTKTDFSIPDLLDIQVASWIDFLQEDILPEKRKNAGLEAVFRNIFPIEDNNKNYEWFSRYETLGIKKRNISRLKLTA